MSEHLKQSQEHEERNIYNDVNRVQDFNELSDGQLITMLEYYEELDRTQLTERQDQAADKVMEHLVFELGWRTDKFNEVVNQDLGGAF